MSLPSPALDAEVLSPGSPPDPSADSDTYENPSPSATQAVMLMCQVVDHECNLYGDMFAVDVIPTILVSRLKESIKATASDTVGRIDANKLYLWIPLKPCPISRSTGISAVIELLQHFHHDPESVAQKLLPTNPVLD
jgi:hypothetical protein